MACSLRLSVLGALLLAALCNAEGGRDSMGKEFIVSLMENRVWTSAGKSNPLQNDVELYVTTTNPFHAARVVVTAPLWDKTWKEIVSVKRGTTQMIKVPWKLRGIDAEVSNKGVHIEASEEISAYFVNKEVYSTDAFIALPLDVLGTEYYAITYRVSPIVSVVATEDNTDVTIEWPKTASFKFEGESYSSKTPTKKTLNKFEVLHMVDNRNSADFTGAHITCSKPCAVTSGNKKVAVNSGRSIKGTADHLTEMLLPVDTWGKLFFTTSTPDRGAGDLYRIVAAEDDTTITFSNSGKPQKIDAGEWAEYDIETGDYQTITADKPVMIAMLGKTRKSPAEAPNGGDPAMSLIIPEPQYASDYTWSTVRTPKGHDFDNKIVVVVKTSEKAGLRMDGKKVEWDEEKVIHGSNPSYTHFWKKVTPGSHNVYHLDPSMTFMAIASGTAKHNSYAYDAGLRLAQINKPCTVDLDGMVPGDILDNDCDGHIDEEKADGIDNDGDGLIDEDLAVPPRINGNWGDWGEYSACSVTCGIAEGTMTRTRECNNPAPANNGDPCEGEATETITCVSEAPCSVDGNWGEWSDYGDCSVSCGEGTKTRTRVCDSPAPAGGGADCAGDAEDAAVCDAGACPVDGNWSEWSDFGDCSAACGKGQRTRGRTCTNPAPANGGADCEGEAVDAEECNEGRCLVPVDGNWGEWTSYTECSATCGKGSQSRTRVCDSPFPSDGGADCVGDAEETADCNEGPCAVPGAWGEWSDYGSCSVTCGEGVKTRTRACDSPAPEHGGDTCPGDDAESAKCVKEDCPAVCGNGKEIGDGWSSWNAWGVCDASCYGTRWRSRGCLGTDRAKCPGEANVMEVCRPQLCSCAENEALKAKVEELQASIKGMFRK